MNGARSPFQRQNRRREDGYRVVKNLADNSTAEVFIYDEISMWGINAKQFAEDMKAIEAKTINLHINSPGGSVFEGTTIYNVLKNHSAKIVTYIDGLAASIASIIALAGDEVIMAENAFMMIHDPWTFSMGDASQLRKDAAILDKIGSMLVQTYANVTHKPENIIKDWMAAETWFSADEALDVGLITSVTKASDANAKVFDLSVFAHVPDGLKDTPQAGEKPTVRDVERILRDAGFSRTEAKDIAIAAKGTTALTEQRDAGTEELVLIGSELLASVPLPYVRASK